MYIYIYLMNNPQVTNKFENGNLVNYLRRHTSLPHPLIFTTLNQALMKNRKTWPSLHFQP